MDPLGRKELIDSVAEAVLAHEAGACVGNCGHAEEAESGFNMGCKGCPSDGASTYWGQLAPSSESEVPPFVAASVQRWNKYRNGADCPMGTSPP